jgi:hypothetical protein
MSGREPAWRIFAGELAAALEEERGEGERATGFVISPYGARMNRVLLAGTVGPAESVGADPGQAFWRARLVDRTGSVTVTAGSFQPRALAALRALSGPTPSLVVGKAHLFRARDGTVLPSIRLEDLRPAGEAEMRELESEIAAQSLERVSLLERLRAAPAVADSALAGEGVPRGWVLGARAALQRYPSADLGQFRSAITSPAPATNRPSGPPPPAPSPSKSTSASGPRTVERRTVSPVPPVRPPVDHAHESVFLDLLDELAEASDDGYADLKEATRRAVERGITAVRVEELLNRLEEDGVLEEPIVGKLRRA